jgi:transposase
MRPARPGSGWPGIVISWGAVGGGGPVQAGTPARGSGQDRPAGRGTAGKVGLHRGAARGAGAKPGRGAARDLVRAREDARADLMGARHRLSKLLLCHGLVVEGAAWTQAHQRWLPGLRFDQASLGAAFDEADGAVLGVQARRDRLDRAMAELAATWPWAPLVGRLGGRRGVGVLTALGLAVEVGDWQRFTGATIGGYLGLVPTEHSSGAHRAQGRSPRPATATPAGCWWRRPGITADPTVPAGSCNAVRLASPLRSGNAPNGATTGCTSAGVAWMLAASAPPSAWWRSPASLPDGAGAWPSWSLDPAPSWPVDGMSAA